MANTFRKIYKRTGSSGTAADYQLVGNVGVDGVELDIMKGASSSAAGEIGLVPKPAAGQQNYVLTGNGTFRDINSILGTPIQIIDTGPASGSSTLEKSYSHNFTQYRYLLIQYCSYTIVLNSNLIIASSIFGCTYNYIPGMNSNFVTFIINPVSENKIQIRIIPGNHSEQYSCKIYGIK